MKSESIIPALTGASVVALAWLLTSTRLDLVIGYSVATAAVAFAISEYRFARHRSLSSR